MYSPMRLFRSPCSCSLSFTVVRFNPSVYRSLLLPRSPPPLLESTLAQPLLAPCEWILSAVEGQDVDHDRPGLTAATPKPIGEIIGVQVRNTLTNHTYSQPLSCSSSHSRTAPPAHPSDCWPHSPTASGCASPARCRARDCVGLSRRLGGAVRSRRILRPY